MTTISCFKKTAFFLYFSCCILFVNAQQVESFSLLRENAYVLNPALCGSKGFLNMTATYRKQFMSIAGAPYTVFIGAEGQIANKNLGLGGYVINDQTGPTGLTGFGVSAAYQIRFDKDKTVKGELAHYNSEFTHMLTVGIGVTMMQYRLNGDQLHPENPNDPDLDRIRRVQYFPDANMGIYYQWRDKLYVGISVPQLLGLNVKYALANGTSELRKVQHINLLLGGRIKFKKLGSKFYIDPVGAFRWADHAPLQVDIGARLTAYNNVWIGMMYRSSSQIVFDLGLMIKNYLRLCYAVDFQAGKLAGQTGVSHEVTLVYRLRDKPAKKEKKTE